MIPGGIPAPDCAKVLKSKEVFAFDDFGKQFSAFDEMRKNGELTDVTIVVTSLAGKKTRFAAHKIVVAAAIPYVRSAFRFTEKKQVRLCLHFMYLLNVVEIMARGVYSLIQERQLIYFQT